MLSSKTKPVTENETQVSIVGGSHKSCVSAQQICSQYISSTKKIQVRILRAGRRPLPSADGPADGALIRMTVDVGPINVRLTRGAKHQYQVLDEQADPAPLQFPDDAAKRLVPESECRRHYIHFAKSGSVVSKTWICSVCGKQCLKQCALMQHLLTDHLNMRMFPCGKCTKSFKTKMVLEQHVKSLHSDLRPYVCAVCQKRFGRVSVLIQHRRQHADKPYTCHCGKSFHQKGNLTIHEQRVHHPSRGPQTPLVYSCLACSAQLASLQLLLDHKRACQPLLESLGHSIKLNPDSDRRLDAGRKRYMNDKLLTKIQSIVQQQERLRRRQAAAPRPPRPSDSLPSPHPAQQQQQQQQQPRAAVGAAAPNNTPRPSESDRRLPTTVTQLRQSQPQQPAPQQQQQQQPRAPQQQQLQQPAPQQQQQQQTQPPVGKMMGVLTAPIRTRSMQLARERNLQPFVLLQSDGEEPTLAKVLRTTDSLELMVPATTDDLRQLRLQQTGHADGDKVDLSVVAIVTHFYDASGTPHVRVQPPSSEQPDCTALSTSQVDLAPTREAPQQPAVAGSTRQLPSAVAAAGRRQSQAPAAPQRSLLMSSGGELLSPVPAGPRLTPAGPLPSDWPPAPPADRAPAGDTFVVAGDDVLSVGTDALPAGANDMPAGINVLSAGGDTLVQFVRQTADGELEPVSAADAALLFSQPGTSYQILPGAGTETAEVTGSAGGALSSRGAAL